MKRKEFSWLLLGWEGRGKKMNFFFLAWLSRKVGEENKKKENKIKKIFYC